MKQAFILPNDTVATFQFVQDGIGDLGNVTMVHDINELSAALQPVKNEEKIVVIDFNWDHGYEFAIQDCAKDPIARRAFLDKTPVVCIHGNPVWLASSLKRKMYEEIGVVGFVPTKDSFTGLHTHSRLRDVLMALQKHDGKITPQVFNDVMANLPEPTPKRRLRGMHP